MMEISINLMLTLYLRKKSHIRNKKLVRYIIDLAFIQRCKEITSITELRC